MIYIHTSIHVYFFILVAGRVVGITRINGTNALHLEAIDRGTLQPSYRSYCSFPKQTIALFINEMWLVSLQIYIRNVFVRRPPHLSQPRECTVSWKPACISRSEHFSLTRGRSFFFNWAATSFYVAPYGALHILPSTFGTTVI